MSENEMTLELMEFVEDYDLDEEEYEALEAWVYDGNSPYTNPDHYCLSGQEINFMKWYWILADSNHPEHKRLMDYRNSKEENVLGYEYPCTLKAKSDRFLNMDYRDSVLRPGQDWFVGGKTFLSPKETKEHLLDEIERYKEAVRKLVDMTQNVEDELSKMNLRGNLFEDVLTIGEVLGMAEVYAAEFLQASKAISLHENRFRDIYLNHTYHIEVDIPF